MPESNQIKWVGVRPTNPVESIPVYSTQRDLRHLSGTPAYGRPIEVSAAAVGAAVTIHQAVNSTTDIDQIYLDAVNGHTAAVMLTLCWGGVTDRDDFIEWTLPPQSGLFCVANGLLLNNNLIVKAFAGTANKINIVGFVNRITA